MFVFASQVKGGCKRKQWDMDGSFDLKQGESLQEGARRWLSDRNKLTKPLTPSTENKRRSHLASCDACEKCSTQFCFSLDAQGKVCVEVTGECGGPKRVEENPRGECEKFAAQSPTLALKEMVKAKIPPEERPSSSQVKNQCPTLKSRESLDIPVDCLGALRSFAQSPPEGVVAHTGHTVLEESQVRLPFECAFMNDFYQQCALSTFLFDWTFKTNQERLLIGAIGPAGMHIDADGPHVRFVPVLFMVADGEDQEAHGLLVRFFLSKAKEYGHQYTDPFLDMCLALFVAVFSNVWFWFWGGQPV